MEHVSPAGSDPASALDAETLAYAASPAQVGLATIHLTDRCLVRAASRDRHPLPPEFVRLRLRQRVECGQVRHVTPAALPAELAGLWDAFVDCGDLLFCLVRRADGPRSFDAVTCFDPGFAGWSVCCADDLDRLADADLIVELTNHAVQRYAERMRSAADERQARSDLRRLLTAEAHLLPELPACVAGQVQSDAPWFLVYDGLLVLPLLRKDRSRVRYVAVTCMVRGLAPAMIAAARRPRRQQRVAKIRAEAEIVRQGPHHRVRRKRRQRVPRASLPWQPESDDD